MAMGDISQSQLSFKRALVAHQALYGATDSVDAYRALYLKELWQRHHFIAALQLRQQMTAPRDDYSNLDPDFQLLHIALQKVPPSPLLNQYNNGHLLALATVVLAAIVIMLAISLTPSLLSPTELEREFNRVAKRVPTIVSKSDPRSDPKLGQASSLAIKSKAPAGNLQLVPFVNHIPNWRRHDD
jgi:hypothetical protein